MRCPPLLLAGAALTGHGALRVFTFTHHMDFDRTRVDSSSAGKFNAQPQELAQALMTCDLSDERSLVEKCQKREHTRDKRDAQ